MRQKTRYTRKERENRKKKIVGFFLIGSKLRHCCIIVRRKIVRINPPILLLLTSLAGVENLLQVRFLSALLLKYEGEVIHVSEYLVRRKDS